MIRPVLGIVFLASALFAQSQNVASESEVQQLREEVKLLRAELAEMRRELQPAYEQAETSDRDHATAEASPKPVDPPQISNVQPQTAQPKQIAALPDGVTLNLLLDTYYGYNFNDPIGRVNLLRAYDVKSNSFSLNQATTVIERAPDLSAGRRWGARVDLQFGLATATLQGNAANEPRPSIYQNIFQAYGTYILPVGNGLTLDFGKWSSSLGIENNYAKDQMNYSRSYWFDFLPFYHMGLRANYKFNDRISGSYWLVNGTNQVEAFNGFKDQLVGLTLQPHKNVNWTINYYLGQEHPDITLNLNPGSPTIASQSGLSITPIIPAPNGKLHIFDSYASWQSSAKMTFALEGDYVIERLWQDASFGRSSAPSHVIGGAAYARYQLTPRTALAARAEYLSDRGGLFSGRTQALKETTLTYDFKVANGFIIRPEWRRDFSNQPFFLTDIPNALKKSQNTGTIGVIWWWGNKEGSW